MKLIRFATSMLLIGLAPPTPAQDVPADVRCLMLSGIFARAAPEERAREAATRAMHFFAGRLDGRVTTPALTNAIRAQNGRIDPKTAGPEMNGCAARVSRATQAIQSAGATVSAGK